MTMSLKDKIVFITGASSGIGEACAHHFAQHGAKLILTARRIEKIEALAETLQEKHHTEVLSLKLDVQDKLAVKQHIEQLPLEWQAIDILVNNAGLALETAPIQSGNIEHWETMINTNLKGLLYVTRTILPGMIERERGHIINVGSIAGHEAYPLGNVYCATKHAVRAISKSLRLDLLGTDIRVSEIAPGAVNTEFSEVRWKDKQRADAFYQDFMPLVADDIADAVVYAASVPKHVNIAEMVVMPTHQASAQHIHRQK